MCIRDSIIAPELLTSEEKQQIEKYHKDVYDKLHDFAEKEYPELLDDTAFWDWLEKLSHSN